jgi:hypothetical protein
MKMNCVEKKDKLRGEIILKISRAEQRQQQHSLQRE